MARTRSKSKQEPSGPGTDLVALVAREPGFAEVVATLQRGASATVDGAWGSACALIAAALVRTLQAASAQGSAPPVDVIVLPRLSDVDDFAADFAQLSGLTPQIFPAWETLPREQLAHDPVFGGRLRVLQMLQERGTARVLVTAFPALLQPVPARDELERQSRKLAVGDQLDPEELLRWLLTQGLERVAAVQLPGEFSMHGGIVDIFSPEAEDPLRLEFFGDEIESIRRFDLETQQRVADLTEVLLTVVGSADSTNAEDQLRGFSDHLADYLPPGSRIYLVELSELVAEGQHYLQRLDNPRGFFSVDATLARCTEFPTASIAAVSTATYEQACHLRIQPLEKLSAPVTEVLPELKTFLVPGERALILCHNAGEQERLTDLIAESGLFTPGQIELGLGQLARGFRVLSEKLLVVSDHELFQRRDVRRVAKKRAVESRAIDSFLELSEGDFVVHLTKGIAKFQGMELLQKEEQSEEHLVLEFRDKVRVFVPVSLIHLVQKYVGGANSAPLLSKLGSNSWERKKQQVADSIVDLAQDMLHLQAERESRVGHSFPADSPWMHQFEAVFPYTETDDQLRAIVDLKGDMEQPRPMDRLICGDVGYGKTEVAMRAAFKAMDAGKQVAVLVPTTVLAEQHYRSFRARMAEFPFCIESLSRFKTKGEQQATLRGLADGSVDLVIGTHRLVQADVEFRDLGLLVIDEEQRFGVEAKERLKKLRLEVDVLTLSATPIPRTLHLSLLGIRDISNLETPPHDRLAIETRICRFEGETVRQAIVRELNRGGQVYFVHNRVYDIHLIADRLQRIVPEARIGIVHGQMPDHEMEAAMVGFVNHQLDVLLATTIIESGLDIPNANTMFIHEADRYGLADLHQLRGRVGRYKHRAYCYMLLEEGKSLTNVAAKRLRAIEEFSDLGAGFKNAMRDLEIRGAGNILGTEQSGHIASVGYELYCQLLESAVRKLKQQPVRENRHVAVDLPISAFLPNSYVPPGRQKIELYRKLSMVMYFKELKDLTEEIRDRFGPLPEPAERLIQLRELQLAAHVWQIDEIRLEGKFAVFGYRHAGKIRLLAQKLGQRLRIVDARSAYLLLEEGDTEPAQILPMLKSMLQPKSDVG